MRTKNHHEKIYGNEINYNSVNITTKMLYKAAS